MDKFGIIGNPVAGSMSPRLFAAAYGGRWPYELIEGADFDASWARFLREYKGINITAPFKEDAFRAADRVAPAAQRIGAVNLAVKTPRGVEAYNTDYEGVRLALAEAGTAAAKTALVVGCGGAGRAAAAAAVDAGMQLVLQNRTRNRAEVLAEVFGPPYGRRMSSSIPFRSRQMPSWTCRRPISPRRKVVRGRWSWRRITRIPPFRAHCWNGWSAPEAAMCRAADGCCTRPSRVMPCSPGWSRTRKKS